MAVSHSRTVRFVAIVGAVSLSAIPLAACTDGGGDAPSFTTTQSSSDDSTPTSDVYPQLPKGPAGDDSEIGTGNGRN